MLQIYDIYSEKADYCEGEEVIILSFETRNKKGCQRSSSRGFAIN